MAKISYNKKLLKSSVRILSPPNPSEARPQDFKFRTILTTPSIISISLYRRSQLNKRKKRDDDLMLEQPSSQKKRRRLEEGEAEGGNGNKAEVNGDAPLLQEKEAPITLEFEGIQVSLAPVQDGGGGVQLEENEPLFDFPLANELLPQLNANIDPELEENEVFPNLSHSITERIRALLERDAANSPSLGVKCD
ncbi:hypothetical protein A4A49_58323 [Nicotiana attenuata]|uniref:Uncharacterized protein n=1 Tax=Nicotiana attenuata TaxID=49451 RepID=A0A314LBE5_NICAT|nr:hypothetical protein A4A49_58323 [Nicotiana attenuata]